MKFSIATIANQERPMPLDLKSCTPMASIFYGTQRSHTSSNGQPLVDVMVFFDDTKGNLDLSRSSPNAQQFMQPNWFLSADQQGGSSLPGFRQQQQTQQQGQGRKNSYMYQAFNNKAPCETPFRLSLNVFAPSEDIHYSPVYNQNGRLLASSDQQPGYEVKAIRSQTSYQRRQFATPGQSQNLALTNADNLQMGSKGFSVNNQGYLNFNNQQFPACNAGNNVWEILLPPRALLPDATTVRPSIRVEQAPRQQLGQDKHQQLARPEQKGQS
ncbi:hypothetical protein LXG23DRAFT_52029 [Yarrowia lipolytica]|nr:hypothetical protein LXG23DRAFT_52029 [Yarrowia lipolytica]